LIRQVGLPALSPALRQEAESLLVPALAAASRLETAATAENE
jgi:hypothetical protein